MKSLFKLGLILIGLFIFGYVEVCKAECAWVLWEKKEETIFEKGKPYPNYSVTWEIVYAVPKFEQCLQMLKANLEKRGGYYTKAKSEGGFPGIEIIVKAEFIMLNGEGYSQTIEFRCFPDTIDPRK